MFKLRLSAIDWTYIVTGLVTSSIAWGAMTARQITQDDKIRTLISVPVDIAALNEHMKEVDRRTTDIQIDVREIRSYLLSKNRNPGFK